MFRLKDTRHAHTAGFLQDAVRVAEYYGFIPLEEALRAKRAPTDATRRDIPKKEHPEIMFARREEKPLVSSAKKCVNCARGFEETVLAWHTNTTVPKERTGTPSVSLELHIVGNTSAIAEVLLIVVADAIAQEAGVSKRTLSINNIGSTESSNRFVRDVSAYLRKHIESISPVLRPRAATDPIGTLVQLIERGHPAAPRAPQAMEYLTEEERRRFWEILEYLETFGIPYELSPHVLGSRDCWAHSLFEISMPDEETGSRIPLAFGGRYDPLTTRFSRSTVPSVMISIACEVRGRVPKNMHDRSRKEANPSIYFAHLGGEARRRSLPVLESLRREGIYVRQGLLFERIGEQMAQARRNAMPYILIMGHKEAVEGTVLVREVATNSQEAVPVSDLTNYLKRHRMGVPKVTA